MRPELDVTSPILEALEQAMEDPLLVVGMTGSITHANLAAGRLLGHEDTGVVGLDAAEAITFHVGPGRGDEGAISGLIPPDRPIAENGVLSRPDGSTLPVHLSAAAIRDHGACRGTVITLRDIGRTVGAAGVAAETEALRADRRRLEELDRVKSNFLNLAAHELRSPLAVARGYAAMLSDGTLGPSHRVDARRALPVMVGKLSEMAALVDQMLETARLEEAGLYLTRTPLDLRDVIRDSLEVTAQVTEHHRVVTAWSRDGLPAVGDRRRLTTLLTNLIDNACKYSEPGTVIHIACLREERWVGFEVRDQGVGIAPEDMKLVFTRFGRVVNDATRHIRGNGLGLYLCRDLARMHGGDLTVTSEARAQDARGGGAVFRLRLPVAASGSDEGGTART